MLLPRPPSDAFNAQPTFSQQVCRGHPSACGHIIAFLRRLQELDQGQGRAGGGGGYNRSNSNSSGRGGIGYDCSEARITTGGRDKSAPSAYTDGSGRRNGSSRSDSVDNSSPGAASCNASRRPRHKKSDNTACARPNNGHHLGRTGARSSPSEPARERNVPSRARTMEERFCPPPPQPPPPPPPEPAPRSFEVRRPRVRLVDNFAASSGGKDNGRAGAAATKHAFRRSAISAAAAAPDPATAAAAATSAAGTSAAATSAATNLVAGSRRRVTAAVPLAYRNRAAVHSNPEWNASTTCERAIPLAGKVTADDERTATAAGAGQGRKDSSSQAGKPVLHIRLADEAVVVRMPPRVAGGVDGAGAGQKRADRREILRWMGRLGVKVATKTIMSRC